MARPATPDQLEHAIQAYVRGVSCEHAAAQFGTSYARLRRVLHERGLWRDRATVQALASAKASATRRARLVLPEQEMVARYLAGESEKTLAERYGVSRQAIRIRLIAAGVTIRSQAEANRLLAARRTPEERKALAEAAHRAARGRRATLEERIKRAQTCERKQLGAAPAELLLQQWLRERGIESICQKAIGPYNADLAASPVAVEIFGGGWHAYGRHRERFPERMRYILDHGWSLVIVWVDSRAHPLTPAAADYIVSFVEQSRRNPATPGEYRMIWGTGEPVPTNSFNFDKLAVVPALGAGDGTRP